MHDVVRVHQAVDEPIPLIRRLHGDALKCLTEGSEGREDSRQLVAESLLGAHAAVVIEHHDDTVGPLQIDPGLVFHLTLLSVVSEHHASMT
jgi:hypothetical protein